jgi:hypothetical protein
MACVGVRRSRVPQADDDEARLQTRLEENNFFFFGGAGGSFFGRMPSS